MSAIDWPGLMRVGLHRLRLTPEQFWALTPAELQVMLGATGTDKPLLSEGLAALIAAYPDDRKDTGDD